MEALTREMLTYDWITFFLVFSLLLIAAIKRVDNERFSAYISASFNKGMVEIMASEKERIISPFGFFLLLFNSINVSLFALFVFENQVSDTWQKSLISFLIFWVLVIGYIIVKEAISYLLKRLILAHHTLQLFSVSKRVYFLLFCLALFVCNVLYWYAFPYQKTFFFIGLLLLFIYTCYVIILNKNLIANKLFYFILYLCAFEIAPILILFKLIFEN